MLVLGLGFSSYGLALISDKRGTAVLGMHTHIYK